MTMLSALAFDASTPSSPPAIATGFVRKLYRILDHHFEGIISWDAAGTAFYVWDVERLCEFVLPLYFRGRLDAFRQQLREHGFERMDPIITQPAVEMYRHAHFMRGSPNSLSSIVRVPLPRRRTRRKKPTATATTTSPTMMVKSEPSPIQDNTAMLEMEMAMLSNSFAGNSSNPLFTDDVKFDILPWLDEMPAVDISLPLRGDGVDASMCGEVLDRHLTEDQVDELMRLLGGGGSELLPSPATPSQQFGSPLSLSEGGNFSEDTIHSMMEWFSSGVPT